ncbi:MAG: DUF4168 domain-containing protein [Campylobacterales bacterium]
MLLRSFTKVLLGATLVFGTSAIAQSQNQNMMQSQTQADVKTDYSDSKVKKFAEAAIKVEEVAAKYQGEMQQSAGDENKINQLRQDADKEMGEVISDIGLSINEYQDMVLAARVDQEFRERVTEQIQSLQ